MVECIQVSIGPALRKSIVRLCSQFYIGFPYDFIFKVSLCIKILSHHYCL